MSLPFKNNRLSKALLRFSIGPMVMYLNLVGNAHVSRVDRLTYYVANESYDEFYRGKVSTLFALAPVICIAIFGPVILSALPGLVGVLGVVLVYIVCILLLLAAQSVEVRTEVVEG